MDEYQVSVKVESNACQYKESTAECAKELPQEQAINGHAMAVEEESDENFKIVQVKIEIERIKDEHQLEDTELGANQAAQSELYAGHDIKQDMVIGTESLQPADAAFKIAKPCVKKSCEQKVGRTNEEKSGTGVELLTARTALKQRKSRRKERLAGKYVCDTCKETFSNKKRLISHVRSHIRGEPFYCATCDKVIRRRNELVHRRLHTREYRCKYCQKQLANLSSFIKHKKTHIQETPFSCGVCQKKFKCASYLHKHERTHSQEKKYACTVCQKHYKQSAHLLVHMLTHGGDSAKRFACKFCSMKFLFRYRLTNHERRHTGETPYACDICEKSFTEKFLLDAHKRVHEGQKGFTCGNCDKSFRSNSDLETHSRTHLGTKPFPCDVCGKYFRQKAHLVSHKVIHTGEKSLSCDMCDKRFSTKPNLARHIQRIHVADKRVHSCDECGKRFGRHCYLTQHLKSHVNPAHGQRQGSIYVCDMCSREFRSKFNFNRHVITKHRSHSLSWPNNGETELQ